VYIVDGRFDYIEVSLSHRGVSSLPLAEQ